MRHSEIGIAKFLEGEKHTPSKEHLLMMEAILHEKIHFFKENNSRDNAVLLITMTDMAWQTIRLQRNVTGDDKEWMKVEYLPEGYNVLKEERGFNVFDKRY